MANEQNKNMDALLAEVNAVLQSADLSGVSANSTGSQDLPDGYYLSELTEAAFEQSKSSGRPQVHLTLKTVENGIGEDVDEEGNAKRFDIAKTSGKFINLYYPIRNDDNNESLKRFVSDMKKFEDKPGHQVLPEEAWKRADVLKEALDLVVGMKLRIYIKVSTSSKTLPNGEKQTSTWKNPITWERAKSIELPE